MTLHELVGERVTKTAQLKAKLESYDKKTLADGTVSPVIPATDLEEIEKRNSELGELTQKIETIRNAQKNSEFTEPVNRVPQAGGQTERKSWFDSAWEATDGLKMGASAELDGKALDLLGMEQKTTMTTSAGYVPESTRSGVQIDSVQIQPTLLDYLQIVPINQNSYKFMKETTFTNNAGVKGEGVAYDEAALALTETTVAMNRLGVYIPVTDDQLEDEPAARAFLERRLRDMVRIKMEAQILNGNGTEPQWEGILGLSATQTLAGSGYDAKYDAVHQAIMNVGRSDATTYGGAVANLIVCAPADWQMFATQRTSDGLYIYGGIVDAVQRRMWGLPVVVNYTLADDTVLVLDTNYFPIGIRRDVKVQMTDSHGELFIADTQVVKVTMKGNVISLRDSAAVKITGVD